MAESKKITELHSVPTLSDDDEFLVVDKSITTGEDASSTGKTSKATMQQLRDGMFPDGAVAGEKGQKGQKGQQGNSVTGPKGPAGPQGDKGISIQGNPGPAGPQGDKGPQGIPGTSIDGVKGSKGDTGSTGEKGPQGNSITGPKGPQGNPGTSTNGVKGQKGESGTNGTDGTDGTDGAKGQKGDGGAKGSTGSSGSPWGGGTFTGNVYHSKPTYHYNSNEPAVYWGFRKSSNKNFILDISNPGAVLSASGTQSTAETHIFEIDTRVQVNAGVLAIADKPAQGEQNRLSMNQTQWDTFRQQNIEGGQLILGYGGKESAVGQIGTWNIDSCPIDFDQKHRDTMRFFSYDLNNEVTIPMAIAPYGVAITDSGTSNDANSWDASTNRVLPQAALKVQGNGIYQIELESRNHNGQAGHAKLGERCKGGIGIDGNGFMRICGDGDETVIDADGNGGHYSGVGIMAFTKEVARFGQHGIEFHVPVEYKATSGNGTSSNGIKTLQGWINDAIVVDDVAILMEQAGGASSNRHRISAWGLNTGMFLSHINPKDDAGFTGIGPGSTSIDTDVRPDLIMAETHLHDGTKKNKDEICFYAFTLHGSDYNVRHTYKRSTKEITGINYLGVQTGGVSGHWKPFAAYATHEFDNNSNRMLIQNTGASYSSGSHNNDEHIQMYSCGLTGEGTQSYNIGTTRYLNIRDIDGFDDVLFWPGSTDTNVSAYASVVSINPWNGRVYIVTGGECNAFHTFQIDPDQKVSGKSWAETFWDELDPTNSTADGYAYGHGHLQYVSSWKTPLQDTNRYATAGANGDLEYSISYDYDTEKPKYIAHCSKYNEGHVTYSGHNVQFIPFSEDWM